MRIYPQNLKSLALLAVLVLCLFAFTLVSIGKAQAEERLSQTPQRPMAEGEVERSEKPKGQGADQVAVETSLVETESVGSTIMTEASPPGQSLSSPVGSTPPASKPEPAPQHAVVIRDGEVVESEPDLVPASQKAQPPAPAPKLSDRPSPGKQAEPDPESAPTSGSAAAELHRGSPEMEVPVAPVSGDVPPPAPSLSEGEGVPTGSPAPSPFEEDRDAGFAPPSPSTLIESVEQQATSAADLIAAPVSSRTPDQAIPPPAQHGLRQALPVSSAVEAASSGAVQDALTQTLTTVADAAAGVLETLGSWTDYSPSGDTTESHSEGIALEPLAPQLPAPFDGSSVFSPSSGLSGSTGPWGGFIVLLLGVLVSGLVLLVLRDGFLCWAACEQPKPSSALLAPLERPG